MQTFKLEVEDSLVDKVMMFLQKLPRDKIKLKEEKPPEEDFIEYLTSHPVQCDSGEEFLSRTEANGQ